MRPIQGVDDLDWVAISFRRANFTGMLVENKALGNITSLAYICLVPVKPVRVRK
jgi:hypothetical protein